MQQPTMLDPQAVAPDTYLLGGYLPVPGYGVLPVNAFLIRGAQPTLIDTGVAALRQDFMQGLRSTVDPQDIRWIWLTHVDADHVGSLAAVLAEAPRARVITSYIGMAKLALQGFPVDRVYLVNPGQRVNVGDRELAAIKPPTFDAPETAALFDAKTGTLFSSDCFGALMQEAAPSANEMSPEALREGAITWATIDAPWLEMLDPRKHDAALDEVRRIAPGTILSAHLPPARGIVETLLGHIAAARGAPRFVGPDQAALERMMSVAA
jgi:flavorubredoxin